MNRNKTIHKIFTGTPLLTTRLRCNLPEQTCNSNILVEDGDKIGLGSLLLVDHPSWFSGLKSNLSYCIATGRKITKGNEQYYEVWGEIYNYEQARVISNTFRVIRISENFIWKKKEINDNKEEVIFNKSKKSCVGGLIPPREVPIAENIKISN